MPERQLPTPRSSSLTHTTQAGLRARIEALTAYGPDHTDYLGDRSKMVAERDGEYLERAAVLDLLDTPPAPHGITNLDEVEVGKPFVLRLWDNGAGACYFEPFTPPAPVPAPAAEPVDVHGVAISIGAMVEEWYEADWKDHLPANLIERRLARFLTTDLASPPPSAAPTDNTALVGLRADVAGLPGVGESIAFISRKKVFDLIDAALASCPAAPAEGDVWAAVDTLAYFLHSAKAVGRGQMTVNVADVDKVVSFFRPQSSAQGGAKE